MKTMKDADVIIIGGGIMGCSIAWQLAKAGTSVIVFERHDICSGSAGATDGVVGYHTKQPGPQMDLAVASIQMFPQLQKELGEQIEFDFTAGGLQPAEDELQWQILSEIAEKQRESGVDIRMIRTDEACALEPQLASDIAGALYCPTSGKVNPMNLTMAFAGAARRHGAVFLTETEVTAILVREGRAVGIRTSKGDFYADAIVNAAGSWAAQVAALPGAELTIPIVPKRGQLAVTEPVGFFMKATVQCALYNIIKFWPERVSDKRLLSLGASLSIEQTANGGMIIGCTRELVGFERHNSFEAMELITKRAMRFFPALEQVSVIRFFTGFRPTTPDGRPMLGEISRLPGFYMAAGHEGDGIALAPVTGKVLADLILEGHTDLDISAFDANRFF